MIAEASQKLPLFEVSSVTATSTHSDASADFVADGLIDGGSLFEYVSGDKSRSNWVQLELSSSYDVAVVEVWLR